MRFFNTCMPFIWSFCLDRFYFAKINAKYAKLLHNLYIMSRSHVYNCVYLSCFMCIFWQCIYIFHYHYLSIIYTITTRLHWFCIIISGICWKCDILMRFPFHTNKIHTSIYNPFDEKDTRSLLISPGFPVCILVLSSCLHSCYWITSFRYFH